MASVVSAHNIPNPLIQQIDREIERSSNAPCSDLCDGQNSSRSDSRVLCKHPSSFHTYFTAIKLVAVPLHSNTAGRMQQRLLSSSLQRKVGDNTLRKNLDNSICATDLPDERRYGKALESYILSTPARTQTATLNCSPLIGGT